MVVRRVSPARRIAKSSALGRPRLAIEPSYCTGSPLRLTWNSLASIASDGSSHFGTRTVWLLVLVTVTSTAPRKPPLDACAATRLTRSGLAFADGWADAAAAMVPTSTAEQETTLISFIPVFLWLRGAAGAGRDGPQPRAIRDAWIS